MISEPAEPPLQVKIYEAAYKLRCSERTVTRLIAAGELRAIGRGRLRRVEYSSILEYISRHRTVGATGGRDNGIR